MSELIPNVPIAFDTDIDWEAIGRQLQAENEALRLAALKKTTVVTSFFENLSLEDVQKTLKNPVFWVGVAAGIILAFSYGLVPVPRYRWKW